jgi:hypothetical protein
MNRILAADPLRDVRRGARIASSPVGLCATRCSEMLVLGEIAESSRSRGRPRPHQLFDDESVTSGVGRPEHGLRRRGPRWSLGNAAVSEQRPPGQVLATLHPSHLAQRRGERSSLTPGGSTASQRRSASASRASGCAARITAAASRTLSPMRTPRTSSETSASRMRGSRATSLRRVRAMWMIPGV